MTANSDRNPDRLNSPGNSRQRRQTLQTIQTQLNTLTAGIDQLETGIWQTAHTQPDRITHTGHPDPALAALHQYDQQLHAAKQALTTALTIHTRHAATHIPGDPPQWACEIAWPIPIPATQNIRRAGTRQLDRTYRVCEPVRNFARTRNRLPTFDEVVRWDDNGRTSWK